VAPAGRSGSIMIASGSHMSAVRELGQPIVVRGDEGRWRRYPDPSVLRPYHTEHRSQPLDRERCDLIAAERELVKLKIIAEHLDVSDLGMTRILDSLRIIQRALEKKRPALGMNNQAAA
jgi:hypothetical protein